MKPVILTLLIFIVLGCELKMSQSDLSNEEDFQNLIEQSEIKGYDIVLSASPSFTTFNLIATNDYLLLCVGIPNPNYFDVLDLSTEEYIGSFGKEGGGPSEFADVLRSAYKEENTIITSNITMGQQIIEINIDSALNSPSYEPLYHDSHETSGVQKVAYLGNSYALLGTRFKERITVIDDEGKTVNRFLDYPFLDEIIDLRSEVYSLLFQSTFATNPKLNRIALFTYDAPIYDIVSFENLMKPSIVDQRHLGLMEYRDESVYGEKSNMYAVGKSWKNKRNFIDATGTENSIFALYSDKSYAKDGDAADYGDLVIEFDWDGNVIGHFLLSQPTKIIEATKDGKYLYSIIERPENDSLIKYTL